MSKRRISRREHVYWVLIAGKVVKRNGRLVGVDLNSIRRAVEASRDAVLARAKYPRNLFGSCCADAQ